jgi:GntR family transcriptional regulator
MPAPPASAITAHWALDRGSTVPAYAQLERRLAALIEAGELAVGDRLPAERDLAAALGISRMTARAALRGLAERGLVERGVGRGTFVARPRVEHDLTALAGFTEVARRQGLAPHARIRATAELPAPAWVARELELEPGAAVWRIERLRLADGAPLVLEDSWLPAGPLAGLLERDLRGSLYALLADHYAMAPAWAEERLVPVLAEEHHATALRVEAGAPLMLVERVARTAAGTPVEFARDHHRGDRARFVVRVRSPGWEARGVSYRPQAAGSPSSAATGTT